MVGAKLTDDNPSITDLSDANRPTKLSEKYSELYDNEWTDAFEALEGEMSSDKEVVRSLLETLQVNSCISFFLHRFMRLLPVKRVKLVHMSVCPSIWWYIMRKMFCFRELLLLLLFCCWVLLIFCFWKWQFHLYSDCSPTVEGYSTTERVVNIMF